MPIHNTNPDPKFDYHLVCLNGHLKDDKSSTMLKYQQALVGIDMYCCSVCGYVETYIDKQYL